jgi:hypothetical protein
MLDVLVGLAEEAGIAVRVARTGESELPPRSGICRVRGRLLLVVASAEPGGGLLEQRFLPPAVRERLDRPGRLPWGSR